MKVLLSVLLVWVVCAALQHCGRITPHSASELLFKDDLNATPFQDWTTANSSNLLSPDPKAAWFMLPLPGILTWMMIHKEDTDFVMGGGGGCSSLPEKIDFTDRICIMFLQH